MTYEEYMQEYIKKSSKKYDDKNKDELESLILEKLDYSGSFDKFLSDSDLTRDDLVSEVKQIFNYDMTYEEALRLELALLEVESEKINLQNNYYAYLAGAGEKEGKELEEFYLEYSGYEGTYEQYISELGVQNDEELKAKYNVSSRDEFTKLLIAFAYMNKRSIAQQELNEKYEQDYAEYEQELAAYQAQYGDIVLECPDKTIIYISQTEMYAEYKVIDNGEYEFKATGPNGEHGETTVDISDLKNRKKITELLEEDSLIILSDNENTKVYDEDDKKIIVPANFGISKESGSKVEEGIVIEDKSGNQYVWIPVESIDGYIKEANGYTETMPEDEKESVIKYKGYYIGRYEAGDRESTIAKKERKLGDSVTNTVSIKKLQTPYNYVTNEEAKTLAENVWKQENYKTAKTKMTSGYAWDTAIKYIEKYSSDSSYGGYSTEGNYKNTEIEKYLNILGEEKKKDYDQSALIPTGQTTALCNIYDMGGNVEEWSTELANNDEYCIYMGGSCVSQDYQSPAGFRYVREYDHRDPYIGFRVALFLK